jgi:uncharacterized delta-60 repeat protein
MLSAGDLDLSFSADGKQLVDIANITNEFANAVVVQADGKVLLAGRATVSAETDFEIVRLLPDGTPDASFGGGDGAVTIDFSVNDEAQDVALDAAGKIVVVGTSSSGVGSNARNFAVARLSANGTLDTSFSGDGKTTVDFGVNDDAMAVAIDSDSAIYVGGYKDLGTTGQFALAKLLSSGAPDTTYSGDGEVFFGFGGNNDSRCYDIAVDDLHHVMMVGYDEVLGSGTGRNFAYARVGPNAVLDPVFSGDGLAVTDFASGDDEARAVGIGIDGRITVGGFSDGSGGDDFTATRLTRGGALDSTFNGDGAFRLNLGGVEAVDDLVIHPDGDITLSGQTSVGSFQAALVRINAIDGQLSTTFGDGGGGIQLINFGAIDDGFAAALDPRDLNTVVAGTDGSGKLAVGRVHDLIDPNFAPLDVPEPRRDFAAYPDHRFVTVSNTQVERLLSDGSLDTSFSGDGIVPISAAEFADAIATDSQGRIIVLTSFDSGGVNNARVRRLLPSGAADSSFSGDGTMTFNFSGTQPFDRYTSLTIDSQDRILIGGQEDTLGGNTDFALARVTAGGSLDTSLGGDGTVSYNMSTSIASLDAIADVFVQPDGKIVCAGDASAPGFGQNIALLRLNANGSKDISFGVLGEVRQDVNNRDDLAFGAALDSFGRIIVCGIATDLISGNNPDEAFIARFDSDGHLDSGFDGDGLLLFSSSFDQSIGSLFVQGDGHILAAGSVEAPAQGRLTVLRRLLSNGQPDASFAGDGIYIDPQPGGVATEIDGAIYVKTFDTLHRLNVQPAITDFKFLFDTVPQRLQVKFNDDVGDALTDFDLGIRNTTTNTNVNLGTYPLASYDHLTNTAVFNFNSILADGRYTATFSNTGITNRQDMQLGGDRVKDFFFLRGDFNHDGTVNLLDFNILASNFGQSNRTFSQGDANYDGTVNLLDFNIVAGKFGTSVAPASSIVPAAPRTRVLDELTELQSGS